MSKGMFYSSEYGFTKAEIEEARKNDTISSIKPKAFKKSSFSVSEQQVNSSADSDSSSIRND